MDRSKVKLSLAKYKFNRFEISIPGLKSPHIIENNYIANVVIDRNYDNKHFLPMFQVDVLVPNSIYRQMQKNSENVYVTLDLQCGYFPENQDMSTSNAPSFRSYIKNTFYAVLSDTTPETNEELQKLIEKENGNNKGIGLGEGTIVNLLLYNASYIHNLRSIINNNLANCSLVDAITYVLNEANLSNILMAPPTKYTKFDEITLTPVSAIKQLQRLCNEYGLHENGSLIFFDLMVGYILERTSNCTAYRINENKITYLDLDASIVNSQKKGCYKNNVEKFNFINVYRNNIAFTSMSEVNEQTIGNNYVAVNASTGEIINQSSSATVSKDSKNITNVVVVSGKQSKNVTGLTKSISEDGFICNMSFSYADLEMLTPNKQFILNLNDSTLKKYNGKYRIVKETTYFDKEGIYFIPNTAIQLKK